MRSTFSAVSTMHEKWLKNKEDKEHQAVAFLDLSAAFDTLSKDIVCKKLKCHGFDNNSVNWFKSYLTERSQRVMIGSTISDPITLKVGSPQGAILSPSIFIILISEVWKALNIDNYCLKDLFEIVPSTRVTRNSNKIRLKSGFKSRLRENSFQFPSVQLWNAAPESVTSAKTETMARNEIKSFVQSLPL